MNEQDKQLLHNAKAHGGTMGTKGRDLLELIDRLDKQLTEIVEAGEPVIEEIAAVFNRLPENPNPETMITLRVLAKEGRRLAQVLNQIEEVKG